jgi:hypothetical protein
MTIIEALRESKASGRSYMRPNASGGFCRYVAGYEYRFDAEDLIADDWELVDTGIPKLTGGRWGSGEP